MGISIEGIKLTKLELTRNKETGVMEATGNYELLSNTGVVLAKQSFNGYSDIKVDNSTETKDAINKMIAGFTSDLNKTLGLE